jgi:hypothetical protein
MKGISMNAEETVAWLNERDPLRQWSAGDDVYCLHCDGVFKAEDVACDHEGDPTCPLCISSTPLDFDEIPWWREDLVDQTADEKEIHNQWRVKPICAEPGKPGRLPERGSRMVR